MNDILRPTASEALSAWAARVRANRDQAEAYREGQPSPDFYAPLAASFRADPARTDEPALNALLDLMVPGETWIDIGAGGGRYALALARKAGKLIAVELFGGHAFGAGRGMAQYGAGNIEVIPSAWPMHTPPRADVAFISHVGYDIEDIGSFLDGMEEAATRRRVAVLLFEAPASVAADAWPTVHGVARALKPGAPRIPGCALRARQGPRGAARGRPAAGRLRRHRSRPALLPAELFIQEGSARDGILDAWLHQHRSGDGVRISNHAMPIGVVTWAP